MQGLAPTPRLLLASRSPRRREFLSAAGIHHDCRQPDFDDAVLKPSTSCAKQWVTSLAFLKAWSTLAHADPLVHDLVLGADTTCERHGRFLGTPADRAEALEILRSLREGEHAVLTGVAIIEVATLKRYLFVDSARVEVGAISEADLESYLDSGAWSGKAGAYNLSERMAAGWPLKCVGDPTTVMGLPMQKLSPLLERLRAEATPRLLQESQ